MHFIVFFLMITQDAPTVEQVKTLPPFEAGERVLASKKHGPIESVEQTDDRYSDHGEVNFYLIERPVRSADGCVRTRWHVTFEPSQESSSESAIFSRAYANKELTLPQGTDCPRDGYAHLNPGTDINRAFSALRSLKMLTSRSNSLQLTCADATKSGLCDSADHILEKIAPMSPWAVTNKDGSIAIWLGEKGGPVTEVIFSGQNLAAVSIERRNPTPF